MTNKGTVLITGGGRRIGAQIAVYLARCGHAIALHYHQSRTAAEKLSKQINSEGGKCTLFKSNLTNEQQTDRLIENVLKKCGNLFALINNASVFKKSSLRSSNIKQLHENLNLHLIAPYILIRQFSRRVKKGAVINILDTHVTQNKTAHFHYLLSKKALRELTFMAAEELAPDIRVNGIAPGLILPPTGKGSDYMNRLAKKIPLKKKGEPDSIAQAAEFLLNNSYITGQILFIDGGEHLR